MVGVPFKRSLDKLQDSWWLNRASRLELPLANEHLKPFFIVSAGRSGTTLLRKKLLNSKYIHIPPESDDFIPFNAIHFTKRNRDGWEKLTSDILESFIQQPFSRYWDTDLNGLSNLLNAFGQEDRSYANLINLLYTFVCREHKPDLQLWGDKTPYLMYRLDWLRKIFPCARYIHVVRDGRAVVHSMISKQNYSFEKAVLRWKDSLQLFSHHCRFVKAEHVLQIKYEDFVADPTEILSELTCFLGVDPHENLMTDRKVFLGDDVLSHHDNLRKPITTESLHKWREEMSLRDISLLNKMFRNELGNLGYKV